MEEPRSLLYVDDDPDICEVVQTSLCLVAGLNVSTAGSGQQAIDLAYELRPDLVLMDVMMPGLDGPSTLKRMRESALIADIPVIFLTAKVLPEEIARFRQLGAIGVIAKPFDPLHLGTQVMALWEQANTGRTATFATAGACAPNASAKALTDSFLQRASSDVVRLRAMVDRAREGDRWVLREIEHVAHSIHGAAAMFGFPELSASGGVIERLVGGGIAEGQHTGGIREPQRIVLQRLLDCTERLARDLDAARNVSPGAAAMLQGRP